MNDLDDLRGMKGTMQLYEHFFDVKYSDTWSLNDLLQYALELILSGEKDCAPAGIIKDFCLAREHMLEEIENAICVQKEKKEIPPMPVVATNIPCLGAFLKQDELAKLEKLLNGEYRGKRGVKNDADETRRDDIARMFIYRDLRTTLSHQDAIGELANKEKIHERSAERAKDRGKDFFRDDLMKINQKSIVDILNVFDAVRKKIIKDEFKRLLASSDESTRKDFKSDEHLNELIKDFYEGLNRET